MRKRRRPGARLGGVAVAALLSVLFSSPAIHAQEIEGARAEIGVAPARVTVGDPYVSALRVVAPPGVSVEYGEPAASDSVSLLEPVELQDAAEGAIAMYRMAAWIAGEPLNVVVPVRLSAADGRVEERWVRLASPEVESVLPAGDEAVEPRPAKGPVSPPLIGQRGWFWWLLLAGALLAAALAYWLLDRVRRRDDEVEVQADPRGWALRQLASALSSPPAHPVGRDHLHQRVSRILRSYCWMVEPEWGRELTTSELVERVARVEGGAAAEALASVLRRCDAVRFGGAPAHADDGPALVEQATRWVSSYPAAALAGEERVA